MWKTVRYNIVEKEMLEVCIHMWTYKYIHSHTYRNSLHNCHTEAPWKIHIVTCKQAHAYKHTLRFISISVYVYPQILGAWCSLSDHLRGNLFYFKFVILCMPVCWLRALALIFSHLYPELKLVFIASFSIILLHSFHLI